MGSEFKNQLNSSYINYLSQAEMEQIKKSREKLEDAKRKIKSDLLTAANSGKTTLEVSLKEIFLTQSEIAWLAEWVRSDLELETGSARHPNSIFTIFGWGPVPKSGNP